jgi:hypothetical protein
MKREEIIAKIKETVSQYGIARAYIFGSFARGEKKYNDIDILIDPPKNFRFFDLCDMAEKLEKMLKTRVDIVTRAGLGKYVRQYVEKEAVPI